VIQYKPSRNLVGTGTSSPSAAPFFMNYDGPGGNEDGKDQLCKVTANTGAIYSIDTPDGNSAVDLQYNVIIEEDSATIGFMELCIASNFSPQEDYSLVAELSKYDPVVPVDVPTLTTWQIELKNATKDTVADNTIEFSYLVSGTDAKITALKQDFIYAVRDYDCNELPNVDGFVKARDLSFAASGDINNGVLTLALTIDVQKVKSSANGLWIDASTEVKFCLRAGLKGLSQGIDLELAKDETKFTLAYDMEGNFQINPGLEDKVVNEGEAQQTINSGACICKESSNGDLSCVDTALKSNADFEICVFPKADGVKIQKIKSVSLEQGELKYNPVNALGIPNKISYLVDAAGKTIEDDGEAYDDIKKIGAKALPMFFEDVSKGLVIKGTVVFQVKSSSATQRRLAQQIRGSDNSMIAAEGEEEPFALNVNLSAESEKDVVEPVGGGMNIFVILAVMASALLVATVLYVKRKNRK